MDLAGPVGQAAPQAPDPAGRVAPDPVDLAATDPVDPGAQAITDPAARVNLETTDQVDPGSQTITDPRARGVRERGTTMTTASISTARRGETDPHLGVLASRRDRHGTGRFRRPVDRG